MRKFAIGIWLLVAVSPGWVYALGLGNIELKSYLNQPLDAEIRLLAATEEDLNTLRAQLASTTDFDRTGVEYQPSLGKLRFSIIKKNGKAYIKITTREPFREPFVNFLVEANWAKGRLLREYTLLIDPPVLGDQPRVSATPPSVTSTPARETGQTRPAPRAKLSLGEDVGTPAPSSYKAGDRYRVQPNDTAWEIAQQIRPNQSVSVEQVLVALLRENPNAFVSENVNLLRANVDLKVPAADAINTLSDAEAREEVARQFEAWRDRRKAASETAAPKTVARAPRVEGRLELLAPDGEGGKADGTAAAGSKKGAIDGQRASAAALEEAAAQRRENKELRVRVEQLEGQIENMRKLAELKDDQLAALQRTLKDLQQGKDVKAEGSAAAQAPTQPAAPEQPAEPPATAGTDGADQQAAQATPDGWTNPYEVNGFKPVDKARLPASTAPASTPAAAVEEQGLWAKVTAFMRDNPLVVAGAGAVAVLLILIGLFVRQRRLAADSFDDSLLDEAQAMPFPEDPLAEPLAAQGGAGLAAPVGDDTNIMPVEEPTVHVEAPPAVAAQAAAEADDATVHQYEDLGADRTVQEPTPANDPLTEADVFLAYGRFQPAESMVLEAIEREPQRVDLKLKLLEVYFAARNQDGFAEHAATLYEQVGGDQDPVWAKVVEMGQELCPEHPLFRTDRTVPRTAPEAPAAPAATAAAAATEADNLTSPDLEAELAEAFEVQKPQRSSDSKVVDFDLSAFEEEFDNLQFPEDATVPAQVRQDSPDIDLGSGSEASSDDGLAAELEELADSIDAQLGDFSHLDTQEFTLDELGEEDLPRPNNVIDFEPVLEGDRQSQGGAEMDLLSDSDEIGTKLDLARAYIDMGDPEGARSILSEVLEEGNDQQRNEAQMLQQQIS